MYFLNHIPPVKMLIKWYPGSLKNIGTYFTADKLLSMAAKNIIQTTLF